MLGDLPIANIVIDGQSIVEVNETKFLGVVIDNRLNDLLTWDIPQAKFPKVLV